MLDRRWSGQLVAMRATLGARSKYFDAKRTLRKPKNPETKFHMHWGREEHLDGVHAKRLKSVPGVVLHEHDGKHNVAGTLREQGRLKPILLNAVGIEDHS